MTKGVEIDINPKVIEWAIHNSDSDYNYLIEKNSDIEKWIKGEKKPTLIQLGKFSERIHIPFGYLLAKEPPEEYLFMVDYRTIKDNLIERPSRGLVETINDMERKMLWMRDYRISIGESKISFLGLYSSEGNISTIVEKIRDLLKLDEKWAVGINGYDNAYNILKQSIEENNVLVMKNSVVLNDTSRRLNINEFRAFTLYDDYSPLIFINGQDSKGGRIFSLLHEFCHLFINNNDDIITSKSFIAENICNKVAANFLIPKDYLLSLWKDEMSIKEEIGFLAKKFKVSQLAMARRLYNLNKIDYDLYHDIYESSLDNYNISKKTKSSGGNPYATKRSNLSTEFVKAVTISAKEGKTLFKDAYKLLNISNPKTFDKLTLGY